MKWKRKAKRRTKPYKTKKFRVWPQHDREGRIIDCPRCGREVTDDFVGRKAHGASCVKIPANRPKGWGVKA